MESGEETTCDLKSVDNSNNGNVLGARLHPAMDDMHGGMV